MAQTTTPSYRCDRCGVDIPGEPRWALAAGFVPGEDGEYVETIPHGSLATGEVRAEVTSAADLCRTCLRTAVDQLASQLIFAANEIGRP